jgi:hypothetical protein
MRYGSLQFVIRDADVRAGRIGSECFSGSPEIEQGAWISADLVR